MRWQVALSALVFGIGLSGAADNVDPDGTFNQTDVSDTLTPLWYGNSSLARMVMKSIDPEQFAERRPGKIDRPNSPNTEQWECWRVARGDVPCRGCLWKPQRICISVWSNEVCTRLAALQGDFKWCGNTPTGSTTSSSMVISTSATSSTRSTSTSTAASTTSSGSTTSSTQTTSSTAVSTSTTSTTTATTSTSSSSTSSTTSSSTTPTTTTSASNSIQSMSTTTTPTSATSTKTTTSTATAPTTTPTVPTPGTVPPAILTALNSADWSGILISQQPDSSFIASTVYKSPDMIKAIVNMATTGVGSQKLWLGDSSANGVKYGLVSIAAFLAQSMKETIQYDACDENNWNLPNGYSAANACGQLGQAYDKYTCAPSEAFMQCEIDPNKVVVATTNAKWYGAPGPMFAAPKSILPLAPKWNYNSPWCNPAEVRTLFTSDTDYVRAIAKNDGSASCRAYAGQKAGGWELCGGGACPNDPAPNFGVPARTDVEGCYFWGRGVIQTTGICNYGKLNWYIGARAASEGRAALYADVDFCKNPESVCTSSKYPELKWMSGLFYWLNAVQEYDDGVFQYRRELMKFVDGGLRSPGVDTGFIHGVSGIVNRGCADPPNCGTGPLDGGYERAANFEKVLRALRLI